MATVVSDKRGAYRLTHLKPGVYQVRCQTATGYVYYGEPARKPHGSGTAHRQPISLKVEKGRTHRNVDFQFAAFKKGTWKSYSTFDGLPHSRVKAIHQTPAGVMWFGTGGGGLCRYDGEAFQNLPLVGINAQVDAIHQTPDGTLWFGTPTGLYHIPPETVGLKDKVEFIPAFTIENDMVGGRGITSIDSAPDGTLWFGVRRRGVYRYDGKKLVNFTTEHGLIGNTVKAVYCTSHGIVWCAAELGISRYDGVEFVNFTTSDGLAGRMVTNIYQTADGALWIATTKGASRYDGVASPGGDLFQNFTTTDGLASNELRAIHQTPDGYLWFGTEVGVSRFDGERFVNFTTRDGLAGGNVKAIYQTSDGLIWFATDNGVSRYDPEGIVSFTTKDGLGKNGVLTVAPMADGTVWIGTNRGGASRYDGTTFETVLPGHYVRKIHRGADGRLYFGTDNGLLRYDGEEFEKILGQNRVMAIDTDADGRLWIGSGSVGGGISRYDPDESMPDALTTFTTRDGLPNNRVWTTLRTADGTRWFGTSGGVGRYDGKAFETLTTKDGLSGDNVLAIHHDPDGILWFGTSNGASRYDGTQLQIFRTSDGLVDNHIWAVHSTPDGLVWFGTESKGVSGYDGQTFTSLDTRDGLAGNWIMSIASDADGSVWFGAHSGGLTHLSSGAHLGGLTRYRRNLDPPKVYIRTVETGGETITDLGTIPRITAGSQVTIKYQAIDFKTLPQKRQYRHRMIEVNQPTETAYNPPTKETHFD